ncbi:NAD-dependent epimerase/dehydratase family protein [Neochlamydia sp. S13]|uniref:NAD-dependent epimerase/dehydratase family protein n=1 Tax=Neochlamydia sp. S13 TaxID=1353976 RepID=UPI0005AB3C0C|nr:NAD-dependent epimerase/dehydratase family protein [Neochlamydia sp. S13]BBI18103.1 Putative dTDP-glucose 4,6-dehydratase, rfbB [Neochlamydia sp. S13]
MIAITGSTGFIGNHLCNFLPFPHKRLVRQPISTIPSQQQFIGNLNNPVDINNFVQQADVLIHLAWVNNPWTSDEDIFSDISHNLLSSLTLFEAYARANPQGHIIFASSGGNMYQKSSLVSHQESDPPHPWSSYSINKLAVENYLALFCRKYGIRGTVLRISNPYGALLPSTRTNGLIGVIFSKLIDNSTLNIIDSLNSVRDYIHLDDLSHAFHLIINNPPEKALVQVFNVGSGQGTSLKEVLDTIEAISKRKINVNLLNHSCKPTFSVLSPKLISQTLNWHPKIELKEGLEKMWASIHSALASS